MGFLESLGKRLAVRIGILLFVAALFGASVGLGGGVISLVISVQKPDELVKLSAKEFYVQHPESSYLHLTDARLRLSLSVWTENGDVIKEVYVPICPNDQEDTDPILFLQTTDPGIIEMTGNLNSDDLEVQRKALADFREFSTPRDFQGMSYGDFMIDEVVRAELQKLNPGAEILAFVEGDAPLEQGEMAGFAVVLLVIGVISLLVLIGIIVGFVKLFSGTKTPPAVPPPTPQRNGPPPIPSS